MTYKYLFFPFTHITDNDLETLLTFFSKFNCLSINSEFKSKKGQNHTKLNQLFEKGKIIPHFLSPKTLDSIEAKFEQYLEWAEIHKGNEHNLKLLLKANPYYTNDSDVTVIKSQIKGNTKEQQNLFTDASKLQESLLFLKMAQLYDEQNEGIDLEFKHINKIGEQLVASLRGLEDLEELPKLSQQTDNHDSGTMMIQERISAWFRCMNTMNILEHDDAKVLFITTNEEIFYYFESNCKDVVNTLDIDNIKVHENSCKNQEKWQDQFENFLMAAMGKNGNQEKRLPQVDDTCSKRGQIKVCNFFMGDINHSFNVADEQISVCLIKLK
ncbi:MAG: hypothetical protein GY857_15475 [Desulfobacula sp.]|nr:hypothetical protein [Desulfobacula sp.]